MFSALYRSIIITSLLALLVCGLYPLAVTEIGHLFFSKKANGNLLLKNEQIIGAKLIGQNFSDPKYFHSRPSFAGQGYDATNSSGSNLGPTNIKLIELFRARIKSIVEENPEIRINQIPVDLITASGSGLDPHISPEAAQLQAARIAKIRQLSVDQVQALIKEKTEGPQWGLFGEPTINVLELNLALDEVSL